MRLAGYALPGRTFSWTVPWPAGCKASSLQLELVEQDLALPAPIQGCP